MKRELIRNLLIAMVTGLVLQQAITVRAAFGDLDNTFSLDGMTTDQSEVTSPSGVALQADGKILVVGSRFDFEVNERRLLLRRYNANGTIDTSFGSNGRAVAYYRDFGYGRNVFVQADGKIVVVGYSDGSTKKGTVWRFNSNGSYDSGFGSFGRVLLGNIRLSDVAGYRVGAFGPQDLIISSTEKLYRLQSNGVLYSLFGSGGIVSKPDHVVLGGTMTVRGTGIYLLGHSDIGAGAVIVKFTVSGTFDQSFGNNGIFTESVSDAFGCQLPPDHSLYVEYYRALAFQTGGKIITAGTFTTLHFGELNHIDYSPILDRHQSNGDFDFSFNGPCSSGIAPIENFYASANALTVLPDDRIIFSLWAGHIHRTTADGFPDGDFQTSSPAEDFVVQPDGKIVVVGKVEWNGEGRIRVSRYLP